MIRKLLVAGGAVVLLLVVICLAVVFSLDLDRYRPQIETKLTSLVGNPVRLGSVSIGWERGIALKLEDVHVFSDPDATAFPVLKLGEASITFDLVSLLKRRFDFTSVELRDLDVHVLRAPQGRVKVIGVTTEVPQTETGPVATSDAGDKVSMPPPILVRRVHVVNGTLRFTDNSTTPPMELEVNRIDAKLSNVSLAQPFTWKAKCAFLSEQQNLEASGTLQLGVGEGQKTVLEHFSLATDLAQISISKINPLLQSRYGLAFSQPMRGTARAHLERFVFPPEPLSGPVGSLEVREGGFTIEQIASPVTDMSLVVQARENKIEISSLAAQFAQGKVKGSGFIDLREIEPKMNFSILADHLSLEHLLGGARQDESGIEGLIDGSLRGFFPLKEGALSLAGEGEWAFPDGLVLHMNLLREVFDRLAIIPALVQTLKSRLSKEYQEKFNVDKTFIYPGRLLYRLEPKGLEISEFRFASDDFEFSGQGRIGFDRGVHLRGIFRIDPELSQAVIRSVNELSYLAQSDGRLQIPIELTGRLDRFMVIPDVRGIATQIAAQKAGDLLNQLLR